MDGIGRIWAEDNVAGCGYGLRHVGEAFLGAEGRDDLRLRIELDTEPTCIIGGLGPSQTRNALR